MTFLMLSYFFVLGFVKKNLNMQKKRESNTFFDINGYDDDYVKCLEDLFSKNKFFSA